MPLRAGTKKNLKCILAPDPSIPDKDLSPFQAHCRKWQHGCGALECDKALNIVLCKGKVPCDIAFVGMAPGPSEDSRGSPFVGPAGQLLDDIVRPSVPEGYRLLYANLVACRPYDVYERKKVMEPSVDQIERCLPRLEELITLAQPRLIVCVGAQARDWLDPTAFRFTAKVDREIPRVHITHPSAMLQANEMTKHAEFRRAITVIMDAIAELEGR